MWLKEVLIVQLILLQNTIFSQPLIETEKNRESRQTKYEECCPCPSVSNGGNFRDQDFTPSQKSSFLRMPLDECPCRSGLDNEGSPSIFYPSFLRGAHPIDRTQEVKQEPKPLLRPEVGLASSVLETLKEATDEEYKDALLRDASRTALKTGPVLLDTEPETTKHSVTIILKPRDLDNGNDAISEASHAHETRCIHSPLRSSNFENSRRMALPRLSKEYFLLPKRQFKEPLHKSLFDMDNSPSTIQENFDVLNRNDLRNKLKINPSLLSGLSSKMDQLRNSWGNPGTKLKMTPEQCDDLNKQTTMNNGPKFTLAAFKNKLRDISEITNAKRLNKHLHAALYDNHKVMDTKGDEEVKKVAIPKVSHFNKGIDEQNPLLKNLLKLRDVELLPPRKTNIDDVSKIVDKQSDLKAAGTESKSDIIMSSKNPTEHSNECYIMDRSFSDEFNSEEPKVTNPKSITSDVSTSLPILEGNQENDKAAHLNKASGGVFKTLCDDTEILDSPAERVLNNNVKTDSQNEIFDFEDQQSNAADDNIDSEPESTNILQQINEEDESTQNNIFSGEANDSDEDDCYSKRFSNDSPINLSLDLDEKDKRDSLSDVRKNSQRSSMKDDMLRILENLRNTVETRFAGTHFDTLKNTQLTPTPASNAAKENPIQKDDLQKLSDSLLKQDILWRSKSAIEKTQSVINDISSENTLNNNESCETSYLKVNDNESTSLDMHETNAQLYASDLPSKNIMKFNVIDTFNSTLNPSIQNDLSNLQIQEHICTVSNESYEVADDDLSTENEMFSQASNNKYNALRPQFSDNHMRASLPQDTEEEPLVMKEKDLKKSFQVPSLEEIRQGITNIIDAGQLEEDQLRLIDPDPLKESSNINSVRLLDTNLRANLLNSDHSSLPSFQRNSLLQRLNLNPQKGRLDVKEVASLKPLKLPSIQNSRAGIFGDYHSLGKDKLKSFPTSNSALNIFGNPLKETPTLDKIRDSLNTNTKNLFREIPLQLQEPQLQLPMRNTVSQTSNSLKNGLKSYADNSVKRVQSNIKDITGGNRGTMSKSKIDSNNIFETITRRREDMKEKLQALHIDFNDRLATIHDKLLDQTNLQSINIPAYTERNNVINLPVAECEKEQPNQLLKSRFSSKQDQKFYSPQNSASKDSITLFTSRNSDDHGFITNQKAELLNGPLLNVKKLSGPHKIEKLESRRNYLEKQRGLKPPNTSNFKISFSSSTVTPVTKQKTPTPNYAKKFPLGALKQNKNLEKKNTVHSKLKEISDVYRTKINDNEDSKRSPSELIPLRIQSTESSLHENRAIKNLLVEPDVNLKYPTTTIPKIGTNKAMPKSTLDAKNAHLVKSENYPKLPKENPFVTNIRDVLRSRLTNIKPTPLASPKDNHDVVPFLDTVTSPSEGLKTIELPHNPLKENTSYKCKMMCVRE